MTEDEKRDAANRQAMQARRNSLKPKGSKAETAITNAKTATDSGPLSAEWAKLKALLNPTAEDDAARDAANRAAVAKTRELVVPEDGEAEKRIKMALPKPNPRRGGMPLPMSKPQRGGRIPNAVDDWQSHRGWNIPGMLDTDGNPITRNEVRSITPASDRQHAIPNWGYTSNSAGQAMDPKQMTARGAAVRNYGETPRPREYSSFGEFLKTMGLGK